MQRIGAGHSVGGSRSYLRASSHSVRLLMMLLEPICCRELQTSHQPCDLWTPAWMLLLGRCAWARTTTRKSSWYGSWAVALKWLRSAFTMGAFNFAESLQIFGTTLEISKRIAVAKRNWSILHKFWYTKGVAAPHRRLVFHAMVVSPL